VLSPNGRSGNGWLPDKLPGSVKACHDQAQQPSAPGAQHIDEQLVGARQQAADLSVEGVVSRQPRVWQQQHTTRRA
jgi:hypothetical protein